MRLMRRLSLACLSLLLLTSQLQAATGPELIPGSASAVLKLMAPEKTLEQASSFVDSVQQGYGNMVLGQSGMLGVGISNPTLKGVDQSKDWWAAVFLKPEAEPGVVFFIPATDSEAMEGALGESFTFMHHDGFGIYSEDDEAMDKVKDHLLSERSESVADLGNEQIQSMFEGSHLAIGVNLVLVKEIYADQLEEFRQGVDEGLKEAQNEMLEVPGMNMAWIQDFAKKIMDKAVVVVEDAEAYTASLTVTDGGVQLKEFVQFAASSRSAQYLAAHPPKSSDQLDKLPAEQLIYWNLNGDLNKLNKWGMTLLPKMLEMSKEEEEKWNEVAEMSSEIEFSGMSGAFSLGDMQSGLIRTVAVAAASPLDKMRTVSAKAAELMDGMEISGMKQEMSYEKNYEEIEGLEVDLMLTKQEMMNADPQLGGFQAQINQILYGGDTIEMRVAYTDKGEYLQTMGGGKEFMNNAIQAYKEKSAGDDRILARDLKPLGKANVVALLDIPTLVKNGLTIATGNPNLPPMPFDQSTLENLDVKRSYIGMSISTSDRGCMGQLHIPLETFKAGMSLFNFFQQAQQQQAL